MKKILFSFLVVLLYSISPLASAYNDVAADNPYLNAIGYMADRGIMQGKTGTSFAPAAVVNRAELMKIILLGIGISKDTILLSADSCFKDVAASTWYAGYVCYAKNKGFISGYADGTFRPEKELTVAEVLKVLVQAFEPPLRTGTGAVLWYQPYVDALKDKNYLPDSLQYLSQPVTRGQMAEMIWRIKEKITEKPFTKTEDLKSGSCYYLRQDVPQNIDLERVKATWLSWYNGVRKQAGLSEYGYNQQLGRTALTWSKVAEAQGSISHKRPGQKVYYDYKLIESWFASLGVKFANVSRHTFTENIGWGVYRCNQTDCTDELLAAIKTTFDFFMSEKGKKYAPHYESIMSPYYKIIGLGVTVDDAKAKYYLTVHYGTEVTSEPAGICKE